MQTPSKNTLDLNIDLNVFPQQDSYFLLDGAVGKLEVRVELPIDENVNEGYENTRAESNIKRIAIICHPNPAAGGTMDNKVVYAISKALRYLGVSVVKFNYRGVGLSEGSFGNTVGEIEDLTAVINWVEKVSVRSDVELTLAGFSFGCYVAASVTNIKKTKQLILVAPAVTIHDFTQLKVNCPWLIIHGTQDEIVPFSAMTAMMDKVTQQQRQKKDSENNENKLILIKVDGVGHFFHGKLVELQAIIANNSFFN